MTAALRGSLVVAAMAAAMPLTAHAQADNSNSFTAPDVVVVAWATRTEAGSPWRWRRDEPRKRDALHVPRESLTAAELGLLYGADFAHGAGTEGPVPVPAP